MSAITRGYAERRAVLSARLDADRAAVAEAFTAVQRRAKVAEAVVSVVRRANRHRVLTGALATIAIVAPFAARTWLKRVAWFLPLVIEGVRLARGRREQADDA